MSLLFLILVNLGVGEDYFPMQLDNKWGFGKSDYQDTTWSEIVQTYDIEGKEAYLFNYYDFGKRSFFRENDKIYEDLYETSRMWYDFGANVGASWTIDVTDTPDTINGCQVTVIAKNEALKIPGNGNVALTNCIHFQFICPIHESERTGILDEWFAPNVGPIKRIIKYRSGNVDWLLKRAVIGGVVFPDPLSVSTTTWGTIKNQWR
jgi:hypothetical protein